ncbi:Uncharacterised protein [Streptococcus pneumoniae]|nr:Uncharacterised protein [Streptococcus pneumoniae]VKH30606.1 Uncharacterised protein [Streptococcus pneumoniae]VLT71913.1 Uncharacterised protein [Streptococcus pneumoniae]VMK93456.1 Uncharacterised protein [Streptococcus pneumoniae]
MDYRGVLGEAKRLRIRVAGMEFFKVDKEKVIEATFDVDAVIKSLEQEEWVSAAASLLKIYDLIDNYRSTLSKMELEYDDTLKALETKTALIEGFIGKQIEKEESNSCREKVRITRRSGENSSIRLQRYLRKKS